MINVHIFDGKLKGKFHPEKIYNREEKERLFTEFLPKLSIIAKTTVQTIMRDMENRANYHSQNDLDASDILADILNKDYTEMLPLIDEQLVDILNLGQCDSGRVTRLLQIWLAMKKNEN